MFPIAGSSLPTSSETLIEALRGGSARHPGAVVAITTTGEWPQLATLAIDLTGTRLDEMPPIPKVSPERQDGFSAKAFSVRALPAIVRGAPLNVEMSAQDAVFSFAPGADQSTLLLAKATNGTVSVRIAVAALEQLIQTIAAEAAREHGVEVKQTRLTLTSRGPRSLSVVAEITAKAFIATATGTVRGNADVDENLVARLSQLRFEGTGMIANLAGGMISPVLGRLEGKTFPLMSLATSDVKLRDVEVEVGSELQIRAQFGG